MKPPNPAFEDSSCVYCDCSRLEHDGPNCDGECLGKDGKCICTRFVAGEFECSTCGCHQILHDGPERDGRCLGKDGKCPCQRYVKGPLRAPRRSSKKLVVAERAEDLRTLAEQLICDDDDRLSTEYHRRQLYLSRFAKLKNADRTVANRLLVEVQKLDNPTRAHKECKRILEEIFTTPAERSRGRRSGQYHHNERDEFWLIVEPPDGDPIWKPLTNFAAFIEAEEKRDDGVEVTSQFVISGSVGRRSLKRIRVPSGNFGSMDWVLQEWGAGCRIEAGYGARDHARAAIQTLSGSEIPVERVFTHVGWRRLEEHGWVYLHAGGWGIGPAGRVDGFSVEMDDALDAFRLPDPTEDMDPDSAIAPTLRILEVLPDRLAVFLLSLWLRSVIAPSDLTGFLTGATGRGKTQLAVLALQHFGADFRDERAPGTFASTGNSNLDLLTRVCCGLVLVDDLAPDGDNAEISKSMRDAARLLRSQGNRAGRNRLYPDGTPRPVKRPQGLLLCTGEDVPRGQSNRARAVIVEVREHEFSWAGLAELQQLGERGFLALTNARYLRWLAGRLDDVRGDFDRARDEARRASKGDERHKRIAENMFELQEAWEPFLAYACQAGSLTEDAAQKLRARVRSALDEIGREQTAYSQSQEVAQRYIEIISSAVLSGAAHVASVSGEVPSTGAPAMWGWAYRPAGEGEGFWRPQGMRVGWLSGDGKELWLDPTAAFALAQRIARDQGEPLGVGRETVHARLRDRGILLGWEKARQTTTVRRTVMGSRRPVLVMSPESLLPTSPETDQTDLGHFGSGAGRRPVGQPHVEPTDVSTPLAPPGGQFGQASAPIRGYPERAGASPVGSARPTPDQAPTRGRKAPPGPGDLDARTLSELDRKSRDWPDLGPSRVAESVREQLGLTADTQGMLEEEVRRLRRGALDGGGGA